VHTLPTMNSTSFMLLLALTGLLSSCATRLSYHSGAPKLPRQIQRMQQGASELDQVTALLRGSRVGGCQFSRVEKLIKLPSCGMDLLASAIYLGLIPTSAPQPIEVVVVGIENHRTVRRTIRINLMRDTSVWHRLVPSKRDSRVIARALLQAMNERQTATH
jgi:hypothetical protein